MDPNKKKPQNQNPNKSRKINLKDPVHNERLIWAEEEEKKNKQLIRRETESSQDVCTLDSDYFSALFLPLASSLHPSCVSHPWWHSPHFPSLAGPQIQPGPASFGTVYTWRIWLWPTVYNTGMKSGDVEFYSSLENARGPMFQKRAAAQRLCCLLLLPCSEHFKPISSAPVQCKAKEAALNHRGPLICV